MHAILVNADAQYPLKSFFLHCIVEGVCTLHRAGWAVLKCVSVLCTVYSTKVCTLHCAECVQYNKLLYMGDKILHLIF